MGITVRKMDLSDIPYVYQEELKIFGKSLGEKTLYNEIMYNDMSRYFIALVDGRRAGYVGSWLTLPNAEILNLFVSEKYRGLGIGRLLMDEVIIVCNDNEIENLTLEVRVSNLYAIKLYEGLGFKNAAIRKKYYENGEDALLMVLDLGVK
ncbi:ribosomal-protein-alanine N-acetyltransferase [Candidatus Izimaplasma bacterium HR1]|jgi:ribosomal-protein-alanine N-acetyltransferase|uniref:ribosomal protein S18-alanine N-acetyltransferase n=1 Tax=Candidatus Izimoplasma sp. HR1 TaxID=1541959 RepID=UPI0004F86A1E|nr:ribosomal-protein-alanine N-acetyltransferase [Candidatus Izimaplasma bacterium HR1]